MKKSKLFRTLTLAVAAALCMATTTVTAYAGGADPDPVPLPETTEAPAEVPEETEEPTTGGMEPESVPVTPQGNATLVDDFFGDKQLITVTTKAGNYFYILIDRANEDKERRCISSTKWMTPTCKPCWRTEKKSRRSATVRPNVKPGPSIRPARSVKTT